MTQIYQLRPIRFTRGFTNHAEGSVLVEMGATRVLCTASLEQKLPSFLRGQATGWMTAEYGMLPRATHTRSDREAVRGKQSGRTQEIQRLIGRSLRMAVDLDAMPGFTLTLDCDVLQADGGTRTASITGAMVAVYDALNEAVKKGVLPKLPIKNFIAAISVGVVNGEVCLDLDYAKDSACDTDMNVVMNEEGQFIEIQGTAEGAAFDANQLSRMLDAAGQGIRQLIRAQKEALAIAA